MITDNRREPRIIREDTLSLRLIESLSDQARSTPEAAEAFYCSSVDISASGMQVLLTDALPIRQFVEIWIVLADNLGTFNLYGEISRLAELDDPDEPNGFLAGIALQNQSPDIRAWRELF